MIILIKFLDLSLGCLFGRNNTASGYQSKSGHLFISLVLLALKSPYIKLCRLRLVALGLFRGDRSDKVPAGRYNLLRLREPSRESTDSDDSNGESDSMRWVIGASIK